MKRRSQEGFTLVEISIVIIGIGLLLGAIFAGQTMIRSTQIRSTVAQIEKFNAAAGAFREKYDCLPGDCVDATNMGFGTTWVGNGDGRIGYCGDINIATCYDGIGVGQPAAVLAQDAEYGGFWQNLITAGLIDPPTRKGISATIAGIGSPMPYIPLVSKSNGLQNYPFGWVLKEELLFENTPVNEVLRGHHFYLGKALNGFQSGTFGGYTIQDIWAIDSKIDDGYPFGGSARSYNYEAGTVYGNTLHLFRNFGIAAGGASVATCVRNDTTPYQYNLDYTGAVFPGTCYIIIQAAF